MSRTPIEGAAVSLTGLASDVGRRGSARLQHMVERGEARVDAVIRRANDSLLSARCAPVRGDVNVGVVLAAYDLGRTNDVLQALAENPALRQASTVVIANSVEVHATGGWQGGQQVVRGSNLAHEFSAYDEGLNVLCQQQGARPEVVVLLNDRALSYRDGFLGLTSEAALRLARDERLALGNLDDPGRTLRTPFGPMYRYLRGNAVVLPLTTLAPTFPMISISGELFDGLVSPTPPDSGVERPLAKVAHDLDYEQYIWGWLTTGWYRGGPVDADSWPRLRAKARDIINEHGLTVRLSSEGITPVYAERAIAVARLPPAADRTALVARLRADHEALGDIIHGDASARRSLASLALTCRVEARRLWHGPWW